MLGRILPMACVVALARVASAGTLLNGPGLDLGYRQMYNLDFAGAHETFRQWGRLHPQDPLGPISDAAAYLYSELDRLHVLQSELFVDDSKFAHREKLTPDSGVRRAFQDELAQGDQLADRILARAPQDRDALFAKTLSLGLRSDYLALIDKRGFAALSLIKGARVLAERLLALDPSYYDAYMAIGVENYLLSLNAAPIRWLLRLDGAQTDRERGLEKLRITATKGHYLLPYARLLLAVAALRDKDRGRARQILKDLAQEFPQNRLYAQELAKLR